MGRVIKFPNKNRLINSDVAISDKGNIVHGNAATLVIQKRNGGRDREIELIKDEARREERREVIMEMLQLEAETGAVSAKAEEIRRKSSRRQA